MYSQYSPGDQNSQFVFDGHLKVQTVSTGSPGELKGSQKMESQVDQTSDWAQ